MPQEGLMSRGDEAPPPYYNILDSLCVEGSIQERFFLPALIVADKDEIAGVHSQRRDAVNPIHLIFMLFLWI